jgi:hypothetical protein
VPWGGSLLVSPTTGIQAETVFFLRLSNWVDQPQDYPLQYGFFYHSLDDPDVLERVLSPTQASNIFNTYLPAGRWELRVRIYDSYGAFSTARSEPITVLVESSADASRRLLQSARSNLVTSAVTRAANSFIDTKVRAYRLGAGLSC